MNNLEEKVKGILKGWLKPKQIYILHLQLKDKCLVIIIRHPGMPLAPNIVLAKNNTSLVAIAFRGLYTSLTLSHPL